MSVTVGVYDFFSYTLPGGLYLFFLWSTFARLGAAPPPIQISNLSIIQVVILVVLSYVLGLLASPLSKNRWFFLFGPVDAPKAAFERVIGAYPNVSLKFSSSQWTVLEGRLALEHSDTRAEIDKYRATHIMLRNVSLALLLLSLFVMFDRLQVSGFQVIEVLKTVLVVLFLVFLSALAAKEGHKFANWSYSFVFELTIAKAMVSTDFVQKIGVDRKSEPVREMPTAKGPAKQESP